MNGDRGTEPQREPYGPRMREMAQEVAERAERLSTHVDVAAHGFASLPARPPSDKAAGVQAEPCALGPAVVADLDRALTALRWVDEQLGRICHELGVDLARPAEPPE